MASTQLAVYGKPEITTLVRFGVPEVPAGGSWVGASLRVRTSSSSEAGSLERPTVHVATGAWDESTVRYATRPATGPTLATYPAGTQPSQDLALDLPVTELVSSAGGQLALAVRGTGADSLRIWSRTSRDCMMMHKDGLWGRLIASAFIIPSIDVRAYILLTSAIACHSLDL